MPGLDEAVGDSMLLDDASIYQYLVDKELLTLFESKIPAKLRWTKPGRKLLHD